MPRSDKNKFGVLLPPATGYSLKVFFGLIVKNKVSPVYYPRLLITLLINLINWPFRTWERMFINPKFKNAAVPDPVFIIGHWRSGTTHLHNILSQDPKMGYLTTYQGVFPDTLFNPAGRFIFRNFTRLLIPGKRKGDRVKLDTSYPQEEEFALGAKTPVCYYYFWFFPKEIFSYYDAFVRLENLEQRMVQEWIDDYKILIAKSLKNTGKPAFISKNPTNTGRLKFLSETFPGAKFIYIYRNPVNVFVSTLYFFRKMGPSLHLQKVTDDHIENAIIVIYKKMMLDYLEQKKSVPANRLVEVRFEDFENNPMATLDQIYSGLDLDGFGNAKPFFSEYILRTGNYRKNRHTISRRQLQKVMQEWGFAMEKYNYSFPENVTIVDE